MIVHAKSENECEKQQDVLIIFLLDQLTNCSLWFLRCAQLFILWSFFEQLIFTQKILMDFSESMR